ncbi:hypothetical protein H8F26_12195 [Synechococcus sp. CBW1006]|nr:hypothetical protein H8F26_12195 [Synechococcus sp. CBW1006]
MLLRSKDVVVSDGETADWIRQVCDEKVSASEPLMTRRYLFQTLPKREAAQISWISVDRACLWTTRQPAYRSLLKNQPTSQFSTGISGFPAQKDGSAAIRAANSPISASLASLQGIG